MDQRTEEHVEEWESRPFSGGYDGLSELADDEFSGVVRANGAWLFVTNGRPVHVARGSIRDFEDASGTAHVAPDPTVPLLFAMQEIGGTTQAKYYTEDTPISEVDDTLSSGSFTGYIELSENVLSGDYYVVYHAGRSMSLAFIGNAERLETGEDAFQRADDEVGIYRVVDVDVEVIDIPGEENEGGTDGVAAEEPGGAATTGEGGDLAGSDDRGDAGMTDEPTRDDGRATSSRNQFGDPTGIGKTTDVEDPDGGAEADTDVTADLEVGTELDDLSPTDSDGTAGAEAEEYADIDVDAVIEEVGGTVDDAESVAGSETESHRTAGDSSGGTPETAEESEPAVDASGAPENRDPHPDRTEPARSHDSQSRRGEADPESPRDGSDTDGPTADSDGDAASDDGELSAIEDILGEGEGADGDAPGENPTEPRFEQEAAWRETRTIPSLDPEKEDAGEAPSGDPDGGNSPPEADARRKPESSTAGDQSDSPPEPSDGPPESDPSPDSTGTASAAGNAAGTRTSTGTLADSDAAGPERAENETDAVAGGGETATADVPEPEAAGSGHADGRGSRQEHPDRSADDEGVTDLIDQEVLDREDTIDRLQQELSSLEADRDAVEAEREELAERLEELRGHHQELREEYDDLAETATQLREDTQTLAEERDRLQARNRELESELEELREALQAREDAIEDRERTIEELRDHIGELERRIEQQGGVAPGKEAVRLSSDQALSGTNLFVRYDSKSDDTLEDAHAGTADADAVNDNLRLEHHTQFEAEGAVIGDGSVPFETFLTDTMEYRFVEWTVRKLLYEIRDSGGATGLQDFYDAIPRIDRVELHGTAEVPDGDGGTDTVDFDIILRDRMGNPLVVVRLNESRDPATEEMMASLEEDASAVKAASEQLAAACMVTASFFAPAALDTAAEATSGSILSRDSKRSYVKLSRKHGYHLCLIESRDGEFHINVPEL